MLTKLLTLFPEMPERDEIVAGLRASLAADNILGEVAYFDHESGSWERMYGWAWLLQLAAELAAAGFEAPERFATPAAEGRPRRGETSDDRAP